MPAYLKLIISLLVAAVAGGLLWFGPGSADGALRWIVPGLAIFMILAIWLFPEAKKLPPGQQAGRGS